MATGLAPRTIRFYRTRGLVQAVKVPGLGNRTFYQPESVGRLMALSSASWSLSERAEADVLQYHVAGDTKASKLISEALVDGAVVMVLADGTVVIRKPLPKEMYEENE